MSPILSKLVYVFNSIYLCKKFLAYTLYNEKRCGQLLSSSNGHIFERALSKNFKEYNIAGVLASWIEYLTLSTLDSFTTLAAVNNRLRQAISDGIVHYNKVFEKYRQANLPKYTNFFNKPVMLPENEFPGY